MQVQSLGQEDPLLLRRKAWQPSPIFLPGESHGQRSLVSYCPWGRRVVYHSGTVHAWTSLPGPSVRGISQAMILE